MDSAGETPAYDPGALKVTVSKFYLPDGASTQLHGVSSDIVLPSLSDIGDFSEASLRNPLPWDAVKPVAHEQLDLVAPYLVTLRERSATRSKSDPGLVRLAEQVARLKKRADEKSVSLNEAERRQELTRAKDEEKESAQEERSHPENRPTIYEITVQNATRPGLPAPEKFKPEVDKKGEGEASREPAAPKSAQGEGASYGRDVVLQETTRILADYVGLLGGRIPLPNLSRL
jgi:carboxyl-terminal processing protease